jgi:hypothetical protein
MDDYFDNVFYTDYEIIYQTFNRIVEPLKYKRSGFCSCVPRFHLPEKEIGINSFFKKSIAQVRVKF